MARGQPSSQRVYKQVARAKAQEQTRETLLRAATEEVEKDNWTQTSLESVAGRAGVSKQTALRHFGSKQGLLDAVIRRSAALVVKERNKAPIGDVPGAVANLVRHYERYGDMVVRMLPYRDAMVRVMGGGERGNTIARAVDYGKEVHEEWIKRTFAPQLAELSPHKRRRRQAQLVATCDVYVWKILRRDIGLEVDEVEDALVEMLERLLAPDAPDTAHPASIRNAPGRRSRRRARDAPPSADAIPPDSAA